MPTVESHFKPPDSDEFAERPAFEGAIAVVADVDFVGIGRAAVSGHDCENRRHAVGDRARRLWLAAFGLERDEQDSCALRFAVLAPFGRPIETCLAPRRDGADERENLFGGRDARLGEIVRHGASSGCGCAYPRSASRGRSRGGSEGSAG